MRRPEPGALFDPATRSAHDRRFGRGYRMAVPVVTLLVGGLVGGYHYEEPFLPYWLGVCGDGVDRADCVYRPVLDWLAGFGGALAFGLFALAAYKFRRIPPSVTCLGCGGRGWIVDLEPTGGRCPRCGHDRFRYLRVVAAGVPAIRLWRLAEVDGRELLQLRRGNSQLQ